MKRIPVDIYRQEVLLFSSYKELERYCKKEDIDLEERSWDGLKASMEASEAMAGVLMYPDGSGAFYIALESITLGNLLHECIHGAFFILENAGVEISFKNQESITYLSQYLFEEAVSKLKLIEVVDG